MRLFLFLSLIPLMFLACEGKRERPPLFGSDGKTDSGTAGAAGASGGSSKPKPSSPASSGDIQLDEECQGAPDPDTSLLCGNQVVPVLIEKPNLYFVVDASGSMEAATTANGSQTKMAAVQDAMIEVTAELGHRISYGLAAYPGPEEDNPALLGCGAGSELFPTQEGDPLTCLNRRGGDVHDEFTSVVRGLSPAGGTPLSATLKELAPILLGLQGQTAIILLTDGAPNCNADARCDVDGCIPNIEGGALPSGICDDNFNCCDSAQVSEIDLPYIGQPESACVDGDASLEVVAQFREAGLLTFVIGVPGSELYADVMNSLAEAGGTSRDGSVSYYDVSDLKELLGTLSKIGTEIALDCEVTLKRPPADADLLNVYFDEEVVQSDDRDGWTLKGDVVAFHGAACDALSSGQVAQLQLVSGCQTIVR